MPEQFVQALVGFIQNPSEKSIRRAAEEWAKSSLCPLSPRNCENCKLWQVDNANDANAKFKTGICSMFLVKTCGGRSPSDVTYAKMYQFDLREKNISDIYIRVLEQLTRLGIVK